MAESLIVLWILKRFVCAVGGEEGCYVGYPPRSVVAGGDEDDLFGAARVEDWGGD